MLKAECLNRIELEPVQSWLTTYSIPASVVYRLGIRPVNLDQLSRAGEREEGRPQLVFSLSGIAFDKEQRFEVLRCSVGSLAGWIAILEKEGREVEDFDGDIQQRM